VAEYVTRSDLDAISDRKPDDAEQIGGSIIHLSDIMCGAHILQIDIMCATHTKSSRKDKLVAF
jgi:hypothetical protein